MLSDRLREKSDLQFKLGRLFGPLIDLIDTPDQFDDQERAERQARFFSDNNIFLAQFGQFCTGQSGHNYAIEYHKMHDSFVAILHNLRAGMPLPHVVQTNLQIAQAAIDAIPVPRTSVILEAGSPFTTYCKLRELCEADATKALAWLDPYMGASNFLRYISGVRRDVSVTLVTSEPGSNTSKRDKQRWDEFRDVSRLYAQECGPTLYRLFVQPNLHDRWVIFDDKRIYALGGSAKDAGAKDYFTISSVVASPENLQRIQKHILTGTEWFGPSVTTHL